MRRWISIRKVRMVAVCALVGVVSTGCLTQNIVVVVEPDGSGNIAITRTMSAMMLAGITMQMQQMKEQFGDSMEVDMPFDPSNPLYNREALERAASQYGVGVTFANARPVDRAGAKGVQVMYAFEDINDVRINPNITMAMMTLFSGDDDIDITAGMPAMEDVQFVFVRSDDESQLRVLLPSGIRDVEQRREQIRQRANTSAEEPEEEMDDLPPHMDMDMEITTVGMGMFGMTGMESPQDAMRMMFAGQRISLAVEVRGEISETTARHPNARRPTRFTVFDIDFDRAMNHPEFEFFIEDMDAMESSDSPDDFMNVLYALPTVTVDDQAELTIKFK